MRMKKLIRKERGWCQSMTRAKFLIFERNKEGEQNARRRSHGSVAVLGEDSTRRKNLNLRTAAEDFLLARASFQSDARALEKAVGATARTFCEHDAVAAKNEKLQPELLRHQPPGQAMTEYVMMIAVILGVLVAAGMIFEEKIGKFFEIIKIELKKEIVSGAYRDQPKRDEVGRTGIENQESPVQIPHYDTPAPRKRTQDHSGE